MQNLLDYFTKGTETTVSGASWGAEIETHFVDEDDEPISGHTSRQILAAKPPGNWELKPDLGRQLLEIATSPESSPEALLATVQEALDWLYNVARQYGVRPVFEPVLDYQGQLLLEPANDADGRRDLLFFELDGRPSLEHLCRIASVQFTISVSQGDAIRWINKLWKAKLHTLDYPNHAHWVRYIKEADAGYDEIRFGGPAHFADMREYARQLANLPVVMHRDKICRLPVDTLGSVQNDITTFLRSAWWYYRLRRYGDVLALEIRPFARRDDGSIASYLQTVREVLAI